MDEILRSALEAIDRAGCHNLSTGRCFDPGSGRIRDALYSADRWCDACIARDAILKADAEAEEFCPHCASTQRSVRLPDPHPDADGLCDFDEWHLALDKPGYLRVTWEELWGNHDRADAVIPPHQFTVICGTAVEEGRRLDDPFTGKVMVTVRPKVPGR